MVSAKGELPIRLHQGTPHYFTDIYIHQLLEGHDCIYDEVKKKVLQKIRGGLAVIFAKKNYSIMRPTQSNVGSPKNIGASQ